MGPHCNWVKHALKWKYTGYVA